MFKRTPYYLIFSEEYKEKMRFIAGPRQSGKTTLAQNFLKKKSMLNLYYNWDQRDIRNRYYDNSYFYNDDLLKHPGDKKKWMCFDEIHKMPKWKNILKDIYDFDKKRVRLIITGSARLDMFRKAGDSLTGRYYLFHLFPLVLKEFINKKDCFYKPDIKINNYIENKLSSTKYYQEELDLLLKFSGFPEPLIESKENLALMWKNNYLDTVLKEDIRDLTNVKNLENVAKLAMILPSKIGTPLSVNSLVNDMEVSYPAIKNYLHLLDLGYFVFKISPFVKNVSRAIKKEQKYYFFDWTRIKDKSFRFENYIAFELFTRVTFWKDHGYGNFDLHFIRNRSGQETDFLITVDQKPWLLIEVKLNEENIASHNITQAKMLGNIPLIQLIYKNKIAKIISENIFVISASRFLC